MNSHVDDLNEMQSPQIKLVGLFQPELLFVRMIYSPQNSKWPFGMSTDKKLITEENG